MAFMKKSVFLTFVLFWASERIFPAQTVNFANSVTFVTPADRLVYDSNGRPLLGTPIDQPASFVAQLYYGADANSLQPVTSPPARFRPDELPGQPPNDGLWLGGIRTLTGFDAFAVVTLQVRAWDSTGGLDYESATHRGASAIFTYMIPSGGPDSAFYMENFRAFTLVPEPSVISLVMVGAISLLFLRRRK
jgi:hypothetical protein